jgi:hypothetical protein
VKKLVPNTRCVEAESEWPRRLTLAELETLKPLFKVAGVEKFSPAVVRKLQKAVQDFQWARSADPGGIFFSSNKEKRYKLNRILKLIAAQRPTKKVELALRGLDGPTSQRLGRVCAGHPRLPAAIRRVLKKIPTRGPDPKRARRQFFDHLYNIVKRQRLGRRVREQEYGRGLTFQQDYGPLLDLMKATAEPFGAAKGSEADIKAVLRKHKKALLKRKNAAAARR